MSHTAEAYPRGTRRMEMEDGLTVMVRKGPRLWAEIQWRQHPCDSASPWQLLSAGLKSEWEQRWLGLSLTPTQTAVCLCHWLLHPSSEPTGSMFVQLKIKRGKLPFLSPRRGAGSLTLSARTGGLGCRGARGGSGRWHRTYMSCSPEE